MKQYFEIFTNFSKLIHFYVEPYFRAATCDYFFNSFTPLFQNKNLHNTLFGYMQEKRAIKFVQRVHKNIFETLEHHIELTV